MKEQLFIYDPPSTPTRAFGFLINEAVRNGKKVYRADIGMPQEPYPPWAKQTLTTVIEQMPIAGYGPEIDPDLSRTLACFYKQRFLLPVEEEKVTKSLIVGLGASELFSLVLPLITQVGDQILTPDPHYPNFDIPIYMSQRNWIVGATDKNHHPQIADFKQTLINDSEGKIKALYLNSPNNPTGAVYTKEEIKQLLELALGHKLWIIWDGVYWNYNFSDNPSLVLELIREYDQETCQAILEQLIVLDSASKIFFLCDWRLGWAMVFNPKLRRALSNAASYRGNISIQYQKALEGIFNSPDRDQILMENRQLYQRKRDLMWQALQPLIDDGLITISQPPKAVFILL